MDQHDSMMLDTNQTDIKIDLHHLCDGEVQLVEEEVLMMKSFFPEAKTDCFLSYEYVSALNTLYLVYYAHQRAEWQPNCICPQD